MVLILLENIPVKKRDNDSQQERNDIDHNDRVYEPTLQERENKGISRPIALF